MFSLSFDQRRRLYPLAILASGLLAVSAAHGVSYVINTDTTDELRIGTLENPETETVFIDVKNTGSITVTNPVGDIDPNTIRAYLGGTASFHLNNSGLLDGRWGAFAYAKGSGGIFVNNYSDGIYSGEDYAVYAMATTGDVSITNDGVMSGSVENVNGEEFRGTVVMQSLGSGTLTLKNSGEISGSQFALRDGAVVTADTRGEINISNTGTIRAYAGEPWGAGTAGTGIYVTSSVTGGTVTNSGAIHAQTAINVEGRNVTVNLEHGSDITGDVILGGSNNTLFLYSDGVSINGDVLLGQGDGNNLGLKFNDANSTVPFLDATGRIDLSGVNMNLYLPSDPLQVGESYFLLHAGGGIDGWLASINGQLVSDISEVYRIGDYDVSFEIRNNTGVWMNVLNAVPEPSTYALILSAGIAGFAVVSRRRTMKAKNVPASRA